MYIRDRKSQRQISKETGISRDTLRKYIRKYENKLIELGKINKGDDMNKVDLI
ncbi:helix-turn-helix domain-containing protein [Crassaminicella indica]|nr:helix-turn-helix domain-containing protein [Crassaminicella indica]